MPRTETCKETKIEKQELFKSLLSNNKNLKTMKEVLKFLKDDKKKEYEDLPKSIASLYRLKVQCDAIYDENKKCWIFNRNESDVNKYFKCTRYINGNVFTDIKTAFIPITEKNIERFIYEAKTFPEFRATVLKSIACDYGALIFFNNSNKPYKNSTIKETAEMLLEKFISSGIKNKPQKIKESTLLQKINK